jgi:hypothetical protein
MKVGTLTAMSRGWPGGGILSAIGIGMALGVMSAWFDSLPIDTPLIVLVAMANAVGPWLVAAFLAGSRLRDHRHGALAGVIALAVAVMAYYLGIRLIYGDRLPESALLTAGVWLVAAALAGPAFGAAGSLWAGGVDRWRVAGVAILAGGLLAEAAYRFISLEAWDGIDLARASMQVAVVDADVAVALPLVLLHRRQWPRAYVTSLGLGIVGLGALTAALLAIQLVLFGQPV